MTLITIVISILGTSRILARLPTIRAAGGVVLESLFLIKYLLAFCESKFRSAILTDNHFFWHVLYLPFFFGFAVVQQGIPILSLEKTF